MQFPSRVLGIYSLDWAGLTHQLNGGEPVSLKEAVKEAATMVHRSYNDGLLRLYWDVEAGLTRQLTKGPLKFSTDGGSPDFDVAGMRLNLVSFRALDMFWSIRIPIFSEEPTSEEKEKERENLESQFVEKFEVSSKDTLGKYYKSMYRDIDKYSCF